MSQLYSDSIFWVETDKIKPNPYQPRREFDENALRDLADSVRQYGVLQPLVVTRREFEKPDGGLGVEYELIAGERRLRASRLAQLHQVPVIIRNEQDGKMKLELAIIENLQREDLNPIDRARAFLRLAEEFTLTHAQIGKKMGKSREYVSNTLRLLQLPQDIMDALQSGKISEGHARTLMMLVDRPLEQATLFKEIVYKRMSVRESEQIARSIAKEKVRKHQAPQSPELEAYQKKLAEQLGTRVHIEQGPVGGKIVIDFFSPGDVQTIVSLISGDVSPETKAAFLQNFIDNQEKQTQLATPSHSVVPVFPGIRNDDVATEQHPVEESLEHNQEESFLEQVPPVENTVEPDTTISDDIYDVTRFSLGNTQQ